MAKWSDIKCPRCFAWKQTIKNTPGAEAEGSCAPHANGSGEDSI